MTRSVEDRLVLVVPAPRVVEHGENHVGVLDSVERTADTDLLDLFRLRSNPRCVREDDGDAVDVDRFFDDVARGARNRRDDRTFGAEQSVEQARLADVWLADDRDAKSLAKQLPTRVRRGER